MKALNENVLDFIRQNEYTATYMSSDLDFE